MLVNKKDDSNIKVIDWGTARIFDNKTRMKRLVGTVSNKLILYNDLSHIISHLKF